MKLFKSFSSRPLFLLLFALFSINTHAQFKAEIHSFKLGNGLTVVLNSDTTFNEVALYLFADAGFKKEQPGQYGMAHLFEHVMLPTRYMYNPEYGRNASQHSINSNAQVFNDYVRYYLHYDKNGLDYPLVALADRLDFQIDSLTQETLQRHINNVNSEISRAESFGSFRWRPVFREALAKGVFGPLHPYGHDQSLIDINKSTKKDVETWFKRVYGAANSTLIVLGNADPQVLKSKVETYFGAIDPGKQSYQQSLSVPVFKEVRETNISLNNDKHVLYFAWAVPGYGTIEDDYFRLVSSLLSDPLNGPIAKAIKAAGIQNAVPFSQTESFKDASVFDVGVEYVDWKDKEKLESLIQSEMKKITSSLLPANVLSSLAAQYELELLKSMEDISQNDARIVEIGNGALYLSDPRYYEKRLSNLKAITPQKLIGITAKWLSNAPFKASINGRQLKPATAAYDYKKSIPFQQPSRPAALPVGKKELGKNFTVYAVTQSRIPIVNFSVVFEAAIPSSTAMLTQYQDKMVAFFENDPGYSKLKEKGLQTESTVGNSTISYKVSTSKQNATEVFNWLAKKINGLSEIQKDVEVGDASSQIQRTLSVLKEDAMGAVSETLATYPLKRVHLLIIGDVNADKLPFDLNTLKAANLKYHQPTPSSTNTSSSSNLLVKQIGETPTSFISIGHAIQPQNIKEEMYQQIILHLLRGKLMSNLREKNGLVYEVYPYSTVPAGSKVLAFWQTSTTTDKTENTIKQIRYELEHLQDDIEKRLPGAKSRVLAELKSKYKSLAAIENTLIESIEYNRPEDYFSKALQELNDIDAAGLLDFIKTKANASQFKTVLFTSPKVASMLATVEGTQMIK